MINRLQNLRFLTCFDLNHLPMKELLRCMGMVEMPGMWSSDELNSRRSTSWGFQENVFGSHTDATETT